MVSVIAYLYAHIKMKFSNAFVQSRLSIKLIDMIQNPMKFRIVQVYRTPSENTMAIKFLISMVELQRLIRMAHSHLLV